MSAVRKFDWVRRGLIFAPDGRYDWMQTHAQNPAVLMLKDRLRVYFNCRPHKGADGNVRAYPTFVDLDINNLGNVLAVHDKPVLELGENGTFDEFGAMACSVIAVGSEIWLYYVGWSRCIGVPYNHAIGLAISKDGGVTFERAGKGPILGRTLNEPFIQNSPFVMKIGDLFRLWYSTGTGWIAHGKGMESVYVLTHATSHDGINWQRNGIPCVKSVMEHECQTNPCVIKLDDRYHMWFCYRAGLDFRNADRGYRIGYAWSDDLRTWHRDDAKGELLPAKQEGWDSQMVCYPCVINIKGKLYMLYSGNHFGQTGFGYAMLGKQ